MVVRLMHNLSVAQCSKDLNFNPRRLWPEALPAIAWQNQLLSGFERSSGLAIDVSESSRSGLIASIKACHPELGLSELARLALRLQSWRPDLYLELRSGLATEYGLRWNERLEDSLQMLATTPMVFQDWVDEKKISARDLAPLLALNSTQDFAAFLTAIPVAQLSRNLGARALELGSELFLMGRQISDLLPTETDPDRYVARLESWRRPNAGERDLDMREDVARWPWPAQVQGQWQRFGDQSGLEIKIRTTSPQDLSRKLERLASIGDAWSCKT